jgi:hypothetical protein
MPVSYFSGGNGWNDAIPFNAVVYTDLLLDPSDDFLSFDFLEPVTYRTRLTGETFDDTDDVIALPRRPTKDEEELVGKTGIVWHVLRSQAGDCKPRDRVARIDGREYVVQQAELGTFDTRFRLLCKLFRE